MRSLKFLISAVGVLACLGTAWQTATPEGVLAGGAAEEAPGDIDCDGDVDSVDALKVLRHVGGLPADQPGGCPEIGANPVQRVGGQGAKVGAGSMMAMSIDMSIAGNTPTSVLNVQDCARLNANGIQDAQETAIDTLTFDLVAQGIPAKAPMISFLAELAYDGEFFDITASDVDQMLAAGDNSNLFDVSDLVPDSDGLFTASVVDTSPTGTEESGSGVLARISITAHNDAPSSDAMLVLESGAHADPVAQLWLPQTLNDATIMVNGPCELIIGIHGDVDCDGDVDSVDGLRILRDVAALPNDLPKGCPPVSG